MNFTIEIVSFVLAFAGALAWPLSFVISTRYAAFTGCIAGILLVYLLYVSGGFLFAVALVSPVGLVVPALALGKLAGMVGFRVRPFSLAEITAALVALMTLYFFEAGFTHAEVYKFGYGARGAAAITLCITVYGLAASRTAVVVVALIAQVLWMSSLVSDNMFDILGHFVLLPIMICTLIYRLVIVSSKNKGATATE